VLLVVNDAHSLISLNLMSILAVIVNFEIENDNNDIIESSWRLCPRPRCYSLPGKADDHFASHQKDAPGPRARFGKDWKLVMGLGACNGTSQGFRANWFLACLAVRLAGFQSRIAPHSSAPSQARTDGCGLFHVFFDPIEGSGAEGGS
jgi:hypothetical protein